MGKTGGGPERLPAQLSQVNLNAAGIDVGATSHFVAVPQDRAEQPVLEFAAFTADLFTLPELTSWPSTHRHERIGSPAPLPRGALPRHEEPGRLRLPGHPLGEQSIGHATGPL